ncbi:helix-turn-helix domain-containing protein [Micromonospora terminaliae]|uniref:Helix-turn-helix domain-containing protein n=1 Tax=Micromonospora terminaliae TaxID=1914461 RepID=A0AAJ2ZJL1_9ACTN|nr:helix-turn-helix transcriptional regulator [Micromonospora terminaliae]NES30233.1 helix-turn-helix transcriptional regulator [Micromonospora terminaliae]QGL47001.1 helix-turn-helix domain-containing protein [Micromonospora terminaliae]
MNSAIKSAIARIWASYSEPLSLDDIAKSAILSRFHFSRVFRAATRVSPGRYLSAVRIYQAKRLLATTTLSVTDISLAVGFNSLGSFTNHFTDSVGTSPSRFRRMWAEGMRATPQPENRSLPESGTVTGTVTLPPGYARARVYIGAFDTPIIQRQPASWTVVEAEAGVKARYCLPAVSPGQWYVRAVATADSVDPEPWTRRSLLLGDVDPVTVTDRSTSVVGIALRPKRMTDLPILYAIPNLETHCAGRAGQSAPGQTAELASQGR